MPARPLDALVGFLLLVTVRFYFDLLSYIVHRNAPHHTSSSCSLFRNRSDSDIVDMCATILYHYFARSAY